MAQEGRPPTDAAPFARRCGGIVLQDTAVLHQRLAVTNRGVTKPLAFEPGTIKAKH
jgi:hypothetical protein